MLKASNSLIIQGITRLLIPIIQIFGLYVIFHGHYSPGGGFQGGALLAASVLLERLVLGRRHAFRLFGIKLGVPLGVLGLTLYTGVGFFGLQAGSQFLDYARLPLDLDPAVIRSFGILFVEIGVGFAVLGTLVHIFDQIVAGDYPS